MIAPYALVTNAYVLTVRELLHAQEVADRRGGGGGPPPPVAGAALAGGAAGGPSGSERSAGLPENKKIRKTRKARKIRKKIDFALHL